jgi:glycosyltransferase involved in cell wall biosynthesis
MNNKKLIFFTFRDFSKFGGGLIRINGILNSISTVTDEVILISNILDENKKSLNSNIKHLNIGIDISIFEKRLLQFCLSIFPIFIVNIIFFTKIRELRKVFKKYNLEESEIIFLEYLDISTGYLAKKNHFIKDYICDIHGLVPNEFKQKKENKIANYIKYISAFLLDKKVFSNSNGIIFASKAMKEYFYVNYPKIKNKKSVILPYFVSNETCKFEISEMLINQIRTQYNIKASDKIIFFAGGFKTLGGITDLVKAFSIASNTVDNIKLFLIGEGEELNNIKNEIRNNKLDKKVILAGLIPYDELRTYQELADIIVCPDRENIYSNLILHLKYIDSLVSNKIVINGGFKAVKEINIDEKLSIDFIPSDIDNLANKIIYAVENNVELTKKYSKNNIYVIENLLYENNPNILLDLLKDEN